MNQVRVNAIELNKEELGDFLTFRKDVADYILECYKFLGDKCLTQLYQALQQGLQQVCFLHVLALIRGQNVSPQKWAFIEAPLFAFKASSDLFSEVSWTSCIIYKFRKMRYCFM
jgi:hypothetical protein